MSESAVVNADWTSEKEDRPLSVVSSLFVFYVCSWSAVSCRLVHCPLWNLQLSLQLPQKFQKTTSPINFNLNLLTTSSSESLDFVTFQVSRSWWEILLWSCLMPTAHIRTGDLVTMILSWTALLESRSMDNRDFWTNRLHLHLDHWISHTLDRVRKLVRNSLITAARMSSYRNSGHITL